MMWKVLLSIVLIARSSGWRVHSLPKLGNSIKLNYPCETTWDFGHLDKIPKYHINLATSPVDRWTPIIKDTMPALNELVANIESIVGGKISRIVYYFAERFIGVFDKEIQEEIKGISKASGLELGKVVLFNIFYEIFTVCTSIIAKDPKTGIIYHSRNLDFGIFMGYDDHLKTWATPPILRKTAVQVIWEKNGEVVGESIHFAGYVGVLTGVRKGKFSFSLNERFTMEAGIINLIKYAFTSFEGKLPGMLAREVLLSGATYEEAKEIFSKEKLFAAVYFILGAPKNEGSIITRGVTDVRILDLKDSPDSWFLVQTNYDFWNQPLFIDDRRTPAKECMRTVFKQKTFQQNYTLGIYNVLKTRPVLNQLTTYHASMSSESGTLIASKESCPKPCPLF